MFKFFKKVRAEMKKEKELHDAMRRIASIPLDYEALQMMIDATANNINAVTIKVTTKDGATIEMIPSAKKGVDFIPFSQRYENRNK